MASIRPLERTLAENIDWNKARINFLAKFLIALIQVCSVNLSEIASVFPGRAKEESHYKRIQRFLRFFEISYAMIAVLIVSLMGVPSPWVLTLDRTNWQLGKTPLNILVLGIVYKGVAIPVLWTILDKKGNSNTDERKAIVCQLMGLFGAGSILYLTADREFIGKAWFKWLIANGIDFRIRIRENTLIANGRGQLVGAKRLFRALTVNKPLVFEKARSCWGLELWVSGMRLASGEYLIVVGPNYTATAIEDYAKRWEIETLFGCLKSRGFQLEETLLIDPERLKKLIALLALAFCWAHVVGEWLSRQKPLKTKKHGRLAKSIFRYGLNHLRRILCNLSDRFQQIAFRQVVQLLSCT
ncbi:MAG: IS4 family transposase [Acidobacteriota bacterium]